MIRRYYIFASGTKYTLFTGNTLVGSTAQTKTWDTTLTGPAGNVVTLKVTTYSKTQPSGEFKLNGTAYVLNDTIPVTLDGTGNNTFTFFLDVGTTTPVNAINVVLTIIAVTKGRIAGASYSQGNDIII